MSPCSKGVGSAMQRRAMRLIALPRPDDLRPALVDAVEDPAYRSSFQSTTRPGASMRHARSCSRRIERDLNDGAQRRLVALRIELDLVAERIDAENGGDAKRIRRLATEVDAALDELRSPARGISPAALAYQGLVEALLSAAREAPLPTTVRAAGVSKQYPREIKSGA